MNAVQWERAKKIFDAALDLPREERDAFLTGACGEDHALRTEVEGLLAADEMAGSFLDADWLSDTVAQPPNFSLSAGEIVAGRFRIVRLLGDGGMGRVYEAYDSELEVQVALKVLRPEIANDSESLLRFRQEVRIAHRLTHPNVCRTFHLDREVRRAGPDNERLIELTFITMEYLDGETLQQLLKRSGRLSPARTLVIARQMASAIEAAHQSGIVHRDIKPGNVMICPAGTDDPYDRVVVTDFGLAKSKAGTKDNEVSSISHRGRAMGTLAYMSPEQLKADDTGPATDIYAFGLVLYEMVTGEKAFPHSQSLTAAFQRVTGAPPSPTALVADLPKEWETAIAACLQVEISDRASSAAHVIEILDKKALPHPVSKQNRIGESESQRRVAALHRRRSFLVVAAAFVGLVSLLVLSLRFYFSRADSKVPSGTLVYLAPVKNETGDKSLDNVTELVQAGLSQSAQINLLDADRVEDYLQQMTKPFDPAIDAATAREIAMRAGAARVIFANVKKAGGVGQLNIDIQQPDNTPARYRDHWTRSFTWRISDSADPSPNLSAELLTAVRTASDWIREKAGESANDIARLDAPPEDVTTKNWEALADYGQAEKLAVANHREDAVSLLKTAVEKDPQFALAYARLGDLLFSLDRTQEGYSAYLKALQEDLSSRLTRRERDFIKGTYAVDTFDFATADESFRDCSVYYETDTVCAFFRAYPLRMLGRSEEAIALLKRLIQAGPVFPGSYAGLTYNYLLLGDFNAARNSIGELRRAGRKDQATLLEGHLAFLEHRFPDAVNAFKDMESAASTTDQSLSYSLLARVDAELGRYPEALDLLTSGIRFDHTHLDHHGEAAKLLDRAYLYSRLHRVDPCLTDIAAALALNPGPDAVLQAASAVGYLTKNANASELAKLTGVLRNMQTMMPANAPGLIYDLARHTVDGELLLALGKTDAAIKEFEAADVLDSPITSRENLARALRIASDHVVSGATQQRLRERSLALYQRVASKPQAVWYYSPHYPPGFYADEVEDTLSLAKQFKPISEASNLEPIYSSLRPGSIAGDRASRDRRNHIP